VLAGLPTRVAGRDPERARSVAAAAGADADASGGIEEDTLAEAGFVLETVVEDAPVKVELLGRVESLVGPGALMATNTSSLRVSELAAPLRNPERFAAMHFLHPADRTELVELVAGERTSAETVEALAGLVRQLGKTPIEVGADVPGFVWNRLQFALLRESLALVEAGVADAATVDTVVKRGLAPRWTGAGPFEIAERGGLDTFARIATRLFPELASSGEVPTLLLEAAPRKAVET
jgi:3-hydroxybutyryl-CoA dehydrogenase